MKLIKGKTFADCWDLETESKVYSMTLDKKELTEVRKLINKELEEIRFNNIKKLNSNL